MMGILAEMYRSELEGLEAAGQIRREGNLKIWSQPFVGRAGYSWHVKIWSGKSSKPYVNNIFRSEADANAYIDRCIGNDKAASEYKEKRKADRKESAAKMVRQLNVGDILVDSWGYDQTNVDFYQVVDKKGSMVAIRPIKGEMVDGSHLSHGMACKVRPVKDAFCGEVLTKKITGYGVSVGHGCASPCAPDSEHYCSWYA